MAISHIGLTVPLSYHAQLLRNCLTQSENGYNGLISLVDTMFKMVDGDPAVEANYGNVQAKFGFTTLAKAKEALDELQALKLKWTSDASQTSVNTAFIQAWSKFR